MLRYLWLSLGLVIPAIAVAGIVLTPYAIFIGIGWLGWWLWAVITFLWLAIATKYSPTYVIGGAINIIGLAGIISGWLLLFGEGMSDAPGHRIPLARPLFYGGIVAFVIGILLAWSAKYRPGKNVPNE
jgi:hypothetical protein